MGADVQIDFSSIGSMTGIAALVGLIAHIATYANKEGKKEQRLAAVEERVKTLAPLETQMATLTANVGALDSKIDSFKSDIRGDIQDLRNYLMSHRET